MKKVFLSLCTVSLMAISVSASTTVKYTVKSGDTLSTIAQKYHTTTDNMKRANGLQANVLKVGMSLKINMNSYAKDQAQKKKLFLAKAIAPKKQEVKKTIKKKKAKKLVVKKVSKNKKIKIAKIKKKIHVVKTKKKSKRLAKVLSRHAKPLALKHAKKQKRVTFSDILFKSSRQRGSNITYKSTKAKNIINIAKTKLGRRYVWGAVGQRGTFDCSGFTSYVYKKNGINIPRTSRNQAKFGKYVARNHLQKGDLIFFDTSKHRKGYVNHVGIYLGNGKFIHASSAKKKVVISNLSRFYAQRYVGARRPS